MRGDIFRLRSSRTARGHEQTGERYGVIVQSDDLPLSTVLVAPTSTSARPARFRPEIEIGGVPTRVLVEQTAALDVESRLADWSGRVSVEELRSIDQALLAILGL
ncbi:MAG: type II toxin-antitoxin system PemK/MazF family toxin [Propionibacteriaceae bacterium]|jgi:mRNA interferase MazF|nr:type II toxin-antitoxin system PemK/MazF family toxin [Propionibacteriaceae bacterium]